MASQAQRLSVYQIDFQAVASGKHIASTKRKVRWRFGFPNHQALAAGRTGVDCRGEEHDIVIIWSVTSGKRQVYMDGTEIHFSSSRAGIFQYSWSAKGNHVIKVVAHASPPIAATPGFRQYDLFIDGQSFFNMPKAYELGIRGPIPSHDRVPGSYGHAVGGGGYGGYGAAASSPSGIRAPDSRVEEETDLQRAISASLQESRQYLAKQKEQSSDDRSALTAPPQPAPAVATGDLMGFAGQRGPPPAAIPDSQTVISYSSMPPSYGAARQAPHHYATTASPTSPYQPTPGYAASGYAAQPPTPQQVYPGALPAAPLAASNALVVSGAPSNPYAATPPPAAPSYGAPPPMAAAYAGPPPAAATAYGAPAQPPAAHAALGYGAPPMYKGAPQQPGAVPTGDLFAPPPVDPFAPVPPPAGDPYGFGQSTPVHDPFAPRPPPPPTRDDITKSILNAYGAAPQHPQPGQQPPQPGQPMPPGQHLTIADGQHGMAPTAGGPSLSMNGYAPPGTEKPLSEMEQAMKRLVNVDRIDEPAEQEYKLTLEKKEEPRISKDGKSKGLPPVATGLVGSHATLNHIKTVKPDTPKTGEGVMNEPPQLFHPDAVHAGALVVHGQGPPPIQRGFGVGHGAPPPNFQQQRW